MDTPKDLDSVVSLTPRCQLWYIGEIRELLSEAHMCTLRESCLGHLLDIGEIKFQGEVFKLLCRRLHSNSLDKNSLIFNFGDPAVEFGKADFCVMTGLKFSGDTSLPKQSKFHADVFLCRNELVFNDIVKAFHKECEVSGGKSVRSLKLAYLVLIYGILLCNDEDSGKVQLGYLHLMDNLENFNLFPWGLVSYQYLVTSTHRLKRELSTIGKERPTQSLETYGFFCALQCWSYEVIPALGTFCATLNTEHLTTFPRILKWIVSRNLTLKDDGLHKFFLSEHGCQPVRMSLTTSEVKRIGSLGMTLSMYVSSPPPFTDLTRPVGRKLEFGSGDGLQSNTKKASTKRKTSRPGISPRMSTSSKSVDALDVEIIEPKEFKRSVPKSTRKRKGSCHGFDATPRSHSNSNSNFATSEGATVVGDGKLNDISNLLLSLKGQIKCKNNLDF